MESKLYIAVMVGGILLAGSSYFLGTYYREPTESLTECAAYKQELEKHAQIRERGNQRHQEWCETKSKWPCKMVQRNRI